MLDPTEPTRYAFEYPDEAGYPDGKGTLSQDQIVLIDELLDDPHVPAFDFEVVKDEKVGIYDAIVGDREVAGLTYDVAGDLGLDTGGALDPAPRRMLGDVVQERRLPDAGFARQHERPALTAANGADESVQCAELAATAQQLH